MDWMKELEDGKIEVIDKKGNKYILEEKEYGVVERAFRVATKSDGNIDATKVAMKLITASLVEPQINDAELLKLPGSTVMRLLLAVQYLYDLNRFL